MASFYAELQVAGNTYPVRTCTYEFTQATDGRGRVVAKVRHGLVRLTLDVPNDAGLLDWAATAYKPLAGRVVFYDAKGGPALETLSWADGQCVGYQEEFVSGSVSAGAYVCRLTLAAPKLTLQAGGPAAYVSPAPGEHSGKVLAGGGLVAEAETVAATTPELVAEPTLVELLDSAESALSEGLTALATLAAVPVALTLALILGSSTPAGGPGIPQLPLLPIDPNLLRLNELVAKHAADALTANEETELITLLAKVKGVHVQKLSDLDVKGPLKGNDVPLPGFYNISLNYAKRTKAATDALRAKFVPIRAQFVKDLAADPSKLVRLKQAGLTDDDLKILADGKLPDGWQVHHKTPLDDGGDNKVSNLMLIQNDPYHKAITNYQKAAIYKMKPGDTRPMQWPTYPGYVYP